jgi:hypothetical protein
MTKQKLEFEGDMRQFVPPSQLWTEFQGDLEFDYDHDVYWPALNKICQEKKAAAKARWEKAGGIIGESEAYLRGGNIPSIGQGSLKTTAETVEVTPEKPSEITPADIKQEAVAA